MTRARKPRDSYAHAIGAPDRENWQVVPRHGRSRGRRAVARLAGGGAGLALAVATGFAACQAPVSTPLQATSPTSAPSGVPATELGAVDVARIQVASTIHELERLAAAISAAAAEGDDEAVFRQVVILADLVEEEIEWAAVQDPSVWEDPVLDGYRAKLGELETLANRATPGNPRPAGFDELLREILAIRAAIASSR
jgi:hypothetical protein